MSHRLATKPGVDFFMLSIVLILIVTGILLVYDASFVFLINQGGDGWKIVKLQALWALAGLLAMLAALYTPYHIWKKVATPLAIGVLLLLAAVLHPHIGVQVKGARRWIFGHIQPSEFAKFAIVLFIAKWCAGKPRSMKSFWSGPFIPIAVMGLMAFLIALEPDLGTCLVVLGAGFGALFFSGVRLRHFAIMLVIAALLICAGVFLKSRHHGKDYQGPRWEVYLNPDKDHTGAGYQVYHSMIAVGTGGIFGRGLGNGAQKYYIPEPYTDFVFATLAEEGGLVASLTLLALLALLVIRGLYIATLTKDPFGAIFAGGISAGLGVQALLNISVVTSFLPDTGVPLPFISYGGSSLLTCLVSAGILLSIYRYSERDEGKPVAAASASERDFDRRWNRGATLSRPEYGRSVNYRGPGAARSENSKRASR